METSAPDIVTSPDSRGVEDQVEPEDPADVVESQGDKHVGVEADAGTSQGGEAEKGEDGEEETGDPRALADPAQAVKVVAKFKDFSKRRRPVSHVSWQKQEPVLAVSHCSPGGTMSLVAWY